MNPWTKKKLWLGELVLGAIFMGIDAFLIPNKIHFPDHVLTVIGLVMILAYVIFSDR